MTSEPTFGAGVSNRRADFIQAAYERLNQQPYVADWGAADVYQFLLGEGLTDAEARWLTDECRPDEAY